MTLFVSINWSIQPLKTSFLIIFSFPSRLKLESEHFNDVTKFSSEKRKTNWKINCCKSNGKFACNRLNCEMKCHGTYSKSLFLLGFELCCSRFLWNSTKNRNCILSPPIDTKAVCVCLCMCWTIILFQRVSNVCVCVLVKSDVSRFLFKRSRKLKRSITKCRSKANVEFQLLLTESTFSTSKFGNGNKNRAPNEYMRSHSQICYFFRFSWNCQTMKTRSTDPKYSVRIEYIGRLSPTSTQQISSLYSVSVCYGKNTFVPQFENFHWDPPNRLIETQAHIFLFSFYLSNYQHLPYIFICNL